MDTWTPSTAVPGTYHKPRRTIRTSTRYCIHVRSRGESPVAGHRSQVRCCCCCCCLLRYYDELTSASELASCEFSDFHTAYKNAASSRRAKSLFSLIKLLLYSAAQPLKTQLSKRNLPKKQFWVVLWNILGAANSCGVPSTASIRIGITEEVSDTGAVSWRGSATRQYRQQHRSRSCGAHPLSWARMVLGSLAVYCWVRCTHSGSRQQP